MVMAFLLLGFVIFKIGQNAPPGKSDKGFPCGSDISCSVREGRTLNITRPRIGCCPVGPLHARVEREPLSVFSASLRPQRLPAGRRVSAVRVFFRDFCLYRWPTEFIS